MTLWSTPPTLEQRLHITRRRLVRVQAALVRWEDHDAGYAEEPPGLGRAALKSLQSTLLAMLGEIEAQLLVPVAGRPRGSAAR